MNLNPIAGDRWTKPGETGELEVLGVRGDKVMMRHDGYEFTNTLTDYLALAAATVRNGGTLLRTETEDCLFE